MVLEAAQGLLLDLRVALSKPLACGPGLSQLPSQLDIPGRWALVPSPEGALLDGKVPHVSGLSAMQQHLLFLLRRGRHPKPCYATII